MEQENKRRQNNSKRRKEQTKRKKRARTLFSGSCLFGREEEKVHECARAQRKWLCRESKRHARCVAVTPSMSKWWLIYTPNHVHM